MIFEISMKHFDEPQVKIWHKLLGKYPEKAEICETSLQIQTLYVF